MDLQFPLAAAEKQDTTTTAQNTKFGIKDIEGFACWIVISVIRPRLTSILL